MEKLRHSSGDLNKSFGKLLGKVATLHFDLLWIQFSLYEGICQGNVAIF